MDKLLNKFSLLQSLAIMILLSLLLPIPILLGVYVHSTYESKQEEFVVIATKKFELSSEIFTESLWNFYPELSQTIINQLSLDKNFVSVKLTDSNGMEFVSKVNQIVQNKKELLTFTKTLSRNGNDIGSVEMIFKKDGLIESLISDIFVFGTLVVFQAIAIMLVISVLYYIKIVKPVRRLVHEAEKLAKKELDKEFVWEGKDEINILGRALDNTRIALNQLFSYLIEQNINLDEKVKQRTKELQEASNYKSEFLANMSHEIRTPMNAIVGMCHLVSKTHLSDSQTNYILKIKDASSVLLRIINDILDFSKIEAGKLMLEHIPFDMHKELKKSLSIFTILAKEKDIELIGDYINTHRFYRGDPYRIVQILNNFLSNAIKFTKDGEVKLIAEEKLLKDGKSKLVLSVSDTGEGIPQEKQDKLFNAFCQVDSSTTRKHGGTGLGLYICTQLASMMGGSISFESEVGKGSIFTLEIDLERVDGAAVQKESGIDKFTPLNILVVDDEKTSRSVLKEYIRSFGFFATTVNSCSKALEILKEATTPFDIFVIDYHLNDEVDGIETLQQIAKIIPTLPPAILITADSDEPKLKAKALDSGFSRFLLKPINPSYLYDDITGLCQVDKTESLIEHSKIDFSDKKILLVEDNEINLEVALYLLKDTEANVEIAKNGFEAVEKVKNNSFDTVLMDIQMPVMDGYEATKIIRKDLEFKGPIIAMTANVMAHDIKQCLEVGMDEHIGKPLDVEEFYGTLLKVLGKKAVLLPKKAPRVDEYLLFDKEGAIARLQGNVKLWEKTFCRFYEKYENLISDINELIESGNKEDLQIYVHSLKGLCGTIGVNSLKEEALKVEKHLKMGEESEKISFEELFSVAIKSFEKLQKEYDLRCMEVKEGTIITWDKEKILKTLDELENALDFSNISKIKSILEELKTYKNLEKKEIFVNIMIACETFDFETALDGVKALKKEI